MSNVRAKRVMRWDPSSRKLRLFRVMWERGAVGQPGGGHSAKLSISLVPRIPFLSVSLSKSYGGTYA